MNDSAGMRLVEGCWIPCQDCDDYWCTEHGKHAYDCECPEIEVWAELGKYPYSSETGAT